MNANIGIKEIHVNPSTDSVDEITLLDGRKITALVCPEPDIKLVEGETNKYDVKAITGFTVLYENNDDQLSWTELTSDTTVTLASGDEMYFMVVRDGYTSSGISVLTYQA